MEPPSGDFDCQRHHAVTGLRSISIQIIHHLAMVATDWATIDLLTDHPPSGDGGYRLGYNASRRIGNSSRITVRRTTTARCHAAQRDSPP